MAQTETKLGTPLDRRAFLKGSLAVAGSAALAPLLGGGGRAASAASLAATPAAKITLHMTDPSFSALPPLIERFNQTHPTIQVVRDVTYDYPTTIQAVQTAIAAQRPPDLAWIGYNDLRYAAANLPHQTITQAAQADAANGGVRYLTDNFAPNILALGQVDGVQHGLPFGISAPIFWYNVDLFKRAGLPTRAPRTWAEAREFARRITQKTGAIGLHLPMDDPWQYQAIIESNGGQVLVKSGNGYRTGLDSPEAIEAMQFLYDMATRDKSVREAIRTQGEQAFFSGKAGIAFESSAFAPSYAQSTRGKFTVASAEMPRWESKPLRSPAGAGNLFIFAQDPAQQKAAWEFITFLNTPQSLTQWCQLITVFPTREGVADNPKYLAPFYNTQPLLKPGLAQIRDAVPDLSWPGHSGPQALQVFFDAGNKIVHGATTDVAGTLKDAAARINGLIAG